MNELEFSLGDFKAETIQAALTRAGLTPPAAAAKAAIFSRCAAAMKSLGHADSAVVRCYYVPGRIEVLGKHTDYAGGRSLLAATERGFCLMAMPRRDNEIRMLAARTGQVERFCLHPELQVRFGTWANYPMTVARRVARNFSPPLRGADIVFDSDLPPAAGMSSSSALLTASYLVLADVNSLPARDEFRRNIPDRESLCGYLGTIENGQTFGALVGDKGVGTFGGSEDHTAILCCQAGKLSQYSYCPVRPEGTIDLPAGFCFAMGCSGVVAEKTGEAMEKYNRVSRLAALVLEAWNRAMGRTDPHLAAAVASDPNAVSRMREALASSRVDGASAADLLDRFEQFHAENEIIIPSASKALAEGDLAIFGEQVDRSQDLTERLLKNQVEETVFLAHTARKMGALAASAFGAGFGGAVWALVRMDQADAICRQWGQAYRKAYPNRAPASEFFLTRPGPGALGQGRE